MSERRRNSIKISRGPLRIDVDAPGYHSVERHLHVEDDSRVTVRLYPRRPVQPLASAPDFYEEAAWQPEPVFEMTPALIIGLGGTGRQVLTHVKKNLLDAGFGKISPQIRLSLFDTPGQGDGSAIGDVHLSSEEVVEFGADLKPLVERLRQQPDPDLDGWFPAEEYAHRLSDDELNLAYGTGQRRPLSRAMLFEDLRQGIFNEGIDIVLLLDCSPSMDETFHSGDIRLTKLQAAKQSALSFLSQIDRLEDRVGIISFAGDAQVLAPLSNQFEQAVVAIQSISSRNYTNIHHALQQADELLFRQAAGERTKVVVLLSDGESQEAPAIAAAKRLREKGVHLVCVGLGDANRDLLDKLASSWQDRPDTFYAADAQILKGIYLRLARRIGQGSRVWRLLRSMSSSVLDDGNLRVIVVASLAGGFGSALLADVAYLARRVGKEINAKSISVSGYLVDAAVFNRVADTRYDALEANTFAAAREIERFQLAQGFPFRMAYSTQHGENQVLNGMLNWRLFDDLYLFDHLPALPQEADHIARERWFDPAFSVFPMIADAICLALGNREQAAPWRNYLRNLQGRITQEQWTRGRAVVGSIGVFRYVLPMYDIFEIFKVRWAIRLLSRLLTGDVQPKTPINPEQNMEESAGQVDRHVRLFLLGYAGYEEVPCPSGLKMVGETLVEGRSLPGSALDNLQIDLASEVKAFGAYLRSALQIMLNGLPQNDWRKARAGKVGYVLAFLERLQEDLEDASLIFMSTVWDELIDAFLKETRKTRQGLIQLLGRLNHLLADEEQDDFDSSLLHLLQERERYLVARLQAQRNVTTRELALQEDEIDAFIDDALDTLEKTGALDGGLARFYWQADAQHGLVLTLTGWRRLQLTADTRTFQPFVDELLLLAAQAGKDFVHAERISKWLQHRLTTADQREDWSHKAWMISHPLLHFDPHEASQVQPALVLAAREKLDWLTDALKRHIPTEHQFFAIQVADPYSLYVSQTVNVVPGDALKSWREHRNVYNHWYGLTETGYRNSYAEPTAVFRAEATSLYWETRLPEMLHQVPRLFSPVLVTALEAKQEARLFALAFASGWIQLRGRNLDIHIPETPAIRVALPDLASFSRHPSPYVIGMVYFVQQITNEQIQALDKALQAVELNRWQPWTTRNWNRIDRVASVLAEDSPGALDFVSYAAMVVRNEFLKRQKETSHLS